MAAEQMVLDVLHVLVPFLLYLFYIAYTKKIDDRENELFLVFITFTALYIVLKFNKPIFENLSNELTRYANDTISNIDALKSSVDKARSSIDSL